jgi:NAD(P)H-nitrite reductase large subunit
MKRCRKAVVIGGSFVGMQAVHSLLEYGLEITVVDIADQIMPRSLDPESSRMVQEYLEEKGVEFLLGVSPVEIKNLKRKKMLILEDGRSVSGEIVIVTAGARPNVGLTEGSSLARDTGLLVDEFMGTNYADIFAAGDVAEVSDCLTGKRKIFGLWTAAVEQGKIAGLNMAGKNVLYPGGMDMNTIEILDLPIITIGKTTPSPSPLPAGERDGVRDVKRGPDELREEAFVHPRKRVYRKFFFEKERLAGAILIGYVEDAGMIGNLIRSKRNIDHGDCHFSLGSLRPRHVYLPYAGGYEFQSV